METGCASLPRAHRGVWEPGLGIEAPAERRPATTAPYTAATERRTKGSSQNTHAEPADMAEEAPPPSPSAPPPADTMEVDAAAAGGPPPRLMIAKMVRHRDSRSRVFCLAALLCSLSLSLCARQTPLRGGREGDLSGMVGPRAAYFISSLPPFSNLFPHRKRNTDFSPPLPSPPYNLLNSPRRSSRTSSRTQG